MLDVRGCSQAEIKQLLLRVWLRQAALGLLVFAVGCFFCSMAGRLALAAGLLWGLADAAVLLGGTVRGLAIPIDKSKIQRWKIFFCRILTGMVIIGGMLCLKLRVAEAFLGYIALHICFFINLQYFTTPKK